MIYVNGKQITSPDCNSEVRTMYSNFKRKYNTIIDTRGSHVAVALKKSKVNPYQGLLEAPQIYSIKMKSITTTENGDSVEVVLTKSPVKVDKGGNLKIKPYFLLFSSKKSFSTLNDMEEAFFLEHFCKKKGVYYKFFDPLEHAKEIAKQRGGRAFINFILYENNNWETIVREAKKEFGIKVSEQSSPEEMRNVIADFLHSASEKDYIRFKQIAEGGIKLPKEAENINFSELSCDELVALHFSKTINHAKEITGTKDKINKKQAIKIICEYYGIQYTINDETS